MITLEDSGAFTRTSSARLLFDWSQNPLEIEYVCEENNRNSPDEKTGVTSDIMPAK